MERRKSNTSTPIESAVEDIEQPGQQYSADSRKKNSKFCGYTAVFGILVLIILLFFFGDASTLNRFRSPISPEAGSLGTDTDMDLSQKSLVPLLSSYQKENRMVPASSAYSLSKLNLIIDLNKKCQVRCHYDVHNRIFTVSNYCWSCTTLSDAISYQTF